MAGIIESTVNKYHYVVHELADPRTQDWPAVSNPLTILTITATYLYFCVSLEPRLMKNRKPFELKNILLMYNIIQVLLSLYLAYRGTLYVFNKEFNLACEVIDYSNSPRGLTMAASFWWYYVGKITELLDTVFFILRKKMNQVSFLHVYHHSLMSFVAWIGVKYFPGGQTFMLGYINSVVHVIMYTYYLISGLGPEYQKYVWWKKHVTVIQLIQFVIVFVHNGAIFFYECNFPKFLSGICCLNAMGFMYMFGNFYIQNYDKTTKPKTKSEAKDVNFISSKVNSYAPKANRKEKVR